MPAVDAASLSAAAQLKVSKELEISNVQCKVLCRHRWNSRRYCWRRCR